MAEKPGEKVRPPAVPGVKQDFTPATTVPLSLDELPFDAVTACVYGAAGIGKTTFGCGSQNLRTFLFEIDKGVLSLRSSGTNAKLAESGLPPIRKELIKVWPVNKYADFVNGLAYFWEHRHEFDLAVIDTFTELQGMLVTELMGGANRTNSTQQDWGQVLEICINTCRVFNSMGKHSIFLCHEKESFDTTAGVMRYRASFKGAFEQEYRKYFSLIARYWMYEYDGVNAAGAAEKKLARVLVCTKDPTNDCKDRSSTLDKFEVPYLDSMFYKILSAAANS